LIKFFSDAGVNIVASDKTTIMPSRYHALPLEHGQVRLKLIAKRFVFVGV
jgi:hypothetical protein